MKQICKKINRFCRSHKASVLLFLPAFLMVVGLSVSRSTAYFTTYVTAKGGYTLDLEKETTIHEEFEDWKKIIRIENTGKADCFVRVKILAGKEFTIDASGSNWSLSEDGYWYYGKVVPAGSVTEDIVASITYPKGLKNSFDVVVIEECTPAVYDKSGKPCAAEDAKWTQMANAGEGADRS